MSLNIKNEETCRLAAELAELTGETKTGAITVALRERLEREKRARDKEALLRDMLAPSPRVVRASWVRDRLRTRSATFSTMSAGCRNDRR